MKLFKECPEIDMQKLLSNDSQIQAGMKSIDEMARQLYFGFKF